MKHKILRFIFLLTLFCTILFSLKRCMGEQAGIIHRLIVSLYYFTPFVAVWMIEKINLKDLVRKYSLSLKKTNYKISLFYVLSVAFIIPLLQIAFAYFFGNLLNISFFGDIQVNELAYSWISFTLPNHAFLRSFLLYCFSVLATMLAGLTFNMVFSLGGEMAWRGFLKKHINEQYIIRNLLTAFIWGIWLISFRIFCHSTIDGFMIVNLFLISLVSSFLLDKIMDRSQSLLVTSGIQGILISGFMPSLINYTTNNSFFVLVFIYILFLWAFFSISKIVYSK